MTTDKFNDFQIAEYRDIDFQEIAELFREVYAETYPHFDGKLHQAERFCSILSENTLINSKVWTAKFNDKMVGFLALAENFVDQLYISKDFQGKGLGGFWISQSKKIYPDFLELYTFA